jgi:hypothetical protein
LVNFGIEVFLSGRNGLSKDSLGVLLTLESRVELNWGSLLIILDGLRRDIVKALEAIF